MSVSTSSVRSARRGASRAILFIALALAGIAAVVFLLLLRGRERSASSSLAPDIAAPAGESVELLSDAERGERAASGQVEYELPGGIEIPAGVRLAGPGRLTGRVLDRAGGAPVAGARVDLLPLPQGTGLVFGRMLSLARVGGEIESRLSPVAVTGTAPDGSFSFEGVLPGRYFIEARGVRAVPDGASMARVLPSAAGGPIDVFVRAGGRILGTLERADGEPAVGARIAVTPGAAMFATAARTGDLALLEARTDGRGRFAVAGVPPGDSWEVTASSPSMTLSRATDVTVRAGEDTEVALRARQGGRVSGRILSVEARGSEDAQAGTATREGVPLAGAHVGAVPRGLRDLAFVREVLESTHAITDAQGRYELVHVPPGEVDVLAIAPGHLPAKGPSTWATEGGSSAVGDFGLARGPLATGRVVDSSGAPLEGVQVRWNMIDMQRFEMDFSFAPLLAQAVEGFEYPLTDVDGRFQAGPFAGDPPHELDFWKVGFEEGEANWTPGDASELTVVLKRGGAIEGIVMDAAKHVPVTSFSIASRDHIAPQPGAPGGLNPFATAAEIEDERGIFRADSLESGKVTLIFRAPGYLDGELEDIEVKEGETTRGVIVELQPGGVVAGRAVDAQGAPVAGARVFARGAQGSAVEVSDEVLPDGGRRSVRRTRSRDPFGGGDVPIGLSDFFTGLGLLGARAVQPGPAGRFELAGVEPGSVAIVAVHRDYLPEMSQPVTVGLETRAEVELVLRKGGGIFGRAVDRFRRPVPGSLVIAVSPAHVEGDQPGGVLYQGRTGEDGAYRIENMVPGSYFVLLTRGDEAMHPLSFLGALNFDLVNVPGDEMVEYDIFDSSSGAARVFGTVTADGDPVQGGTLIALSFEGENMFGVDLKLALIQGDGTYEFKGLMPGEYRLRLEDVKAAGERLETQMLIDVPDRPEVRFDLALPSGTIEGRVLDAASRAPIANASVYVKSDWDGASGSLFGRMLAQDSGESERTDERGAFRFTRLQAASYHLTVRPPRGEESGRYSPAEPLEIELDEDEVARGVEILLEPALALEGTVIDAAGAPIEGARVSATALAAARGELDQSDANGHFRVDFLGEGTYTVTASAQGYAQTRVGEVKLERGPQKPPAPLAIVLQRGVEVRVRVVGADGLPVSGATARLVARGQSGTDVADAEKLFENLFTGKGVSESDGLLALGPHVPGSYVLEVRRGLQSMELEVEVPDQPEVELRASLR